MAAKSRVLWCAVLVACALSLALAPMSSSEPKAGGLLAFVREGNIHVYDFGAGEERQLTFNGVAEGQEGTSYGCPTLIDWDHMLFLSTENSADGVVTTYRLHSLDPAGGSEYETLDDPTEPLGLGYCGAANAIYYLQQTGPVNNEGDNFGAEITLFAFLRDTGVEATPCTTWYGGVGLGHCRIRRNNAEDATEVSIPAFPTDVSDFYDLADVQTGEKTALLTEEQLGANLITGIDFGESGRIYATIGAMGDAPLASGLYEVDPLALEHTLIAPARDPWGGMAVSEGQGYAATASDQGVLSLTDLDNGRTRKLCEGTDPDFFPK
jgi:hypothetical protein